MYSNIPAYKKFVDDQGIQPDAITCDNDIPIMTKENYVESYPLTERMRADAKPVLYAQSSGTTGTPVVWPIGRTAILQAGWGIGRAKKYDNIQKVIGCITLDLAEWYGGLFALGGALFFVADNPEQRLLIKTDEYLTNLPTLLTNQDADLLCLFTYPEIAEIQLKQLKKMHIDNLKRLSIWLVGGTLTLDKQMELAAIFPNKKMRFLAGYFTSDAGTVGMNGVLSLKQGFQNFPGNIQNQIAKYYDPLNATVFSPLPEGHIEIIDNIFHLTNLYNPAPILRYRTNDIGGRVEDIEFHKPLYWIIGRGGDQLIIKGATLNLTRAKEYLIKNYGLADASEITIQKNKANLVLPTWRINFKTERKVDVEKLEQSITDIIIEDSYEVRRRLESERSSIELFKPRIEIYNESGN